MKKYFGILRKCPLFDGIEDNDISALLSCLGGKVMRYGKKETIFSEGSPASHLGIVLSGKVQIMRIDYYGNRSIMAGLESSELFGEAFACAGAAEIPVDVLAAEDCEVLLIDCTRIIHSCTNACGFHNRMIHNLLRIVANKNLEINQKLEICSKRTTREKLMAYLMMTAKKCGKSSFIIPFDRQELADYLEVDRSGLSAEIGKLRLEGVLECRKNSFRLLK